MVKSFIQTENRFERRRVQLVLVRHLYNRALSKRLERRYSCTIHSGAAILDKNRQVSNSIVIGRNTHIRGELFTFGHGGVIHIGEYCYVGENTRVWSAGEIRIGNRVLIAHNCSLFDSDTHPMSAQARHQHFVNIITTGHPLSINLRESHIFIEDDAWIGAHSIVLKGITIGRGAVVGAGSVVTKDVAPWTVVAGNPARVIREIPENER